jgi:hypothetical protein
MNPTEQDFINEAVKKLEYNSHDLGELGMFVRLEYAENIFREKLQQQQKKYEELMMTYVNNILKLIKQLNEN